MDYDELSSLSKEFDKDLMLKLIQRGGFIFFLDGYDEISLSDKIIVKDENEALIEILHRYHKELLGLAIEAY